MKIPGSQARMWVASPTASTTSPTSATPFPSAAWQVFDFREANINPRAPRNDATSSEGWPGFVRAWTMPGLAANPGGAGVAIPHPLGGTFPLFKNMPYEVQLPGVGVVDIDVQQATWNFGQVPFRMVPNSTIIMPQRYVQIIIAPNWQQITRANVYCFFSIYIEEAPHRINVKENQPLNFKGYSNGPWTYPGGTGAAAGFEGFFPTGV